MLITVCAVLISFLIYFFVPGMEMETLYTTAIFLAGGISVFLGTIFLNTMVLTPLQSLEQKLFPDLMNILRGDHLLRFGRFFLFFFFLISLVFAALSAHGEVIYMGIKNWMFLLWIILFGISLDVLRDSWRRFVNFLNPSYLVSHLNKEALHSIQKDDRNALLNDINCLSEVGLHAVEKSKLALSTQTLQSFPGIIKTFFDSTKSIGHAYRDANQAASIRGEDASNFIVFYLLQRLELINDKALRERQETVCRQMIMVLGKIIVNCAYFDLSAVAFPTHFLTKFGLKAQQHHFDEVAVLTTSTLLEVAKTIVEDIDLTYSELQNPFQAIINGLGALARSTFRKHKDSDIKVLMQPLVDLKTLFKTEKMAQHRDTPQIIQKIDNVLDEFTVLEQVMQTLPPIPGMEPPPGPAMQSVPTI